MQGQGVGGGKKKRSNKKLEWKNNLKKQFGKMSPPTTNIFKQQGFHTSEHYFHVLNPIFLSCTAYTLLPFVKR